MARGPPENIVDAWQEFTGTLKEPIIPTSRFQVSCSTFLALPKALTADVAAQAQNGKPRAGCLPRVFAKGLTSLCCLTVLLPAFLERIESL